MMRAQKVDSDLTLAQVMKVMPKTLDEVTKHAAGLSGTDQLKLARILLEMSEPEAGRPTDVQDA